MSVESSRRMPPTGPAIRDIDVEKYVSPLAVLIQPWCLVVQLLQCKGADVNRGPLAGLIKSEHLFMAWDYLVVW